MALWTQREDQSWLPYNSKGELILPMKLCVPLSPAFAGFDELLCGLSLIHMILWYLMQHPVAHEQFPVFEAVKHADKVVSSEIEFVFPSLTIRLLMYPEKKSVIV